MNAPCTRRHALRALAAAAAGCSATHAAPAIHSKPSFKLFRFEADITPPVGHPCMGGGISPVTRVEDPLYFLGLGIAGAGDPIVIAAADWCEIRNDAYEAWRNTIAAAAGTRPQRVLFTSVHQHDAPVADLTAQRLLESRRSPGAICDLAFHARVLDAVAAAVRRGRESPRPLTHVGVGQAKVERVASNRRYIGDGGKPRFDRTSATREPAARAAPEGTIDPTLRALSFWDGGEPLAVVNAYATHPMSHYGKGEVSADFVGMARGRRREDEPGVLQMYVSGGSGNVTAGKFNDGAPERRRELAARMEDAMRRAWAATQRHPADRLELRIAPLRLEPRGGAFTRAELERRLASDPKPFGQCLAALGLSWRERAGRGAAIDVPALDLGAASYLVLPGESYVEYQIHAQDVRPDTAVLVAGYGECATGYVPTETAWEEGDTNLHDWCWVAPGAEHALRAAIAKALGRG